jgi:fido (protein-threonine AMPylation protein)
MDVRVGNHIAPEGGPDIPRQLQRILDKANRASDGPWSVHIAFETLHPYMDGNGRAGRAIWAWQMRRLGHDPFALPFLHRFYYQTLDASR